MQKEPGFFYCMEYTKYFVEGWQIFLIHIQYITFFKNQQDVSNMTSDFWIVLLFTPIFWDFFAHKQPRQQHHQKPCFWGKAIRLVGSPLPANPPPKSGHIEILRPSLLLGSGSSVIHNQACYRTKNRNLFKLARGRNTTLACINFILHLYYMN